MKIRDGFVSNSSSSSFIMSLGVVTDSDKFNELYAVNLNADIWPDSVEIYKLKELREQDNNGWNNVEYQKKNNKETIKTDSFDGSVCEVDVTGLSDDTIVYYSYAHGPEPTYNDDYEYNYDDVDIEWFDEDDQNAAIFVNEPFMKGEYTYGAGYNG